MSQEGTPLAGFWSKLMIIIALVQAKFYVAAVLAVLASVITLWYYLILQHQAFFGQLNETWKNIREAPFWMSTATVLLGLLCILIGVFFPFVVNTWLKPAANVLTNGMGTAFTFLRF